jgi:hypothetical protein
MPSKKLVLSPARNQRCSHHLTGDTAKAIANQRRAIGLLPEKQSGLRAPMEEVLANFD